jgi:SH3-like domain-containing protein
MMGRRFAVAALALFVATAAGAADEKLPHFASLRVDPVNLRTGPGTRYPVEWVYQKKGLPVEVTATFDVWRRVRDADGTEGWVQERMLTQRRTVLVTGAVRTLRSAPETGAKVVARAEPGVIAGLLDCKGGWCRIETQNIKGWLPRADLWGVYSDEAVAE